MRPFGISWERWPSSGIDMSIFLFNGLLLLGFVVVTIPDVMVQGLPGPTQTVDRQTALKKCRYTRNYYSLLEARCHNVDLTEVPTNLKTDIQVLDATWNRVRELTNESLLSYKNLAYIYLADNFVQNIEEAAFAGQHYLEVLDLSNNGCDNLPKSLFQLPYLRTLYLSINRLTDSVFKVPVSSPLIALHLGKNKLTKIPDMGLLPTLTHLNVSENIIVSINSEDLASFCSLNILDLSKNPIRFKGKDCECQTLNTWLKVRQIKSNPESFDCNEWPGEKDEQCANAKISNRTYELYNKCKEVIQLKMETEKARSLWVMVVSCVSVFIVCVFIALFCVHKRNRRRRRKQKEQQQQLAANNANTELLNSNLTSGNS